MFLGAVTYQSVASIVKQCDRNQPTPTQNALTSSSAGTTRRNGNSTNQYADHKTRPTKAQYEALMMKHPCNICGKYGHWKRSHRSDGSLPDNVKAVEKDGNSATNGYESKKKSISFNMAKLVGSSSGTVSSQELGPLVDDGAPYSAIGVVELKLLAKQFGLPHDWSIKPVPDSFKGHSHWQYGTGEHASPAREILGSTVLSAQSDSGRTICITHLVLQGSSQWVLRKNITRKADIEHIDRNALTFKAHGEHDCITLTNSEVLSYIMLSRFVKPNMEESVLNGLSGRMLDQKPWNEIKSIIDKVHKHVCGHANFTDFQSLLKRNELWNEAVASYVHKLVEECTACRATALPHPNRKVSISSMSKHFNEVVCVDHFYLGEIRLMHCMDLVSRFSTVQVVDSANLDDAVSAFEACWVNQFWYPESIHGDKAFATGDFKNYMDKVGIAFRPVPPGRHSKNAIESKHNVIRSIYLAAFIYD